MPRADRDCGLLAGRCVGVEGTCSCAEGRTAVDEEDEEKAEGQGQGFYLLFCYLVFQIEIVNFGVFCTI